MGQPVSRIIVHPPILDVGDGGSPLPNVTASSRAAASGSFAGEGGGKGGFSSPSVGDDAAAGVAPSSELLTPASVQSPPRLGACLQRGIRGCAAGGGTSSTTSLAGIVGGSGGHLSSSMDTTAVADRGDAAGGTEFAPKGAAEATASTSSRKPPPLASTNNAAPTTAATLAQRIDRFLFPPPKISFHHCGPVAQQPPPRAAGRKRRSQRAAVDPPPPPPRAQHQHPHLSSSAASASDHGRRTTLLWGASSSESHHRRIRDALSAARGMRGAEGLGAAGFEFRRVPCERHRRPAARPSLPRGIGAESVEAGRKAEEREKGVVGGRAVWGRQRSMSDGDCCARVAEGAAGAGEGRPWSSHGGRGVPNRKDEEEGGGEKEEEEKQDRDEEQKTCRSQTRERSQSDPLSSSLRRRYDDEFSDQQHWVEIMPTHPADAGDVVESAAIREKRVGEVFFDRDRYESGASLETVDYGEGDGYGSGEGVGSSTGKEGCIVDKRSATADVQTGGACAGQLDEHAGCEALPEVLMSRAGHEFLREPSSPTAASRVLADLDRVGFEFPEMENSNGEADIDFCPECITRLHHVQSSIAITPENRNRFIADGDMYDEIARLCQEHAHDLMAEEGNLEWVTVCNDHTRGEPVRALVDRDHVFPDGSAIIRREGRDDLETLMIDRQRRKNEDVEGAPRCTTKSNASAAEANPKTRPTLLIVTGKGKVRAGVFSRFHLISSGIEPSTALPMVREARRRGMAVVLLDPNARGDRNGMETFELSVEALFGTGADHGEADVNNFPSPNETEDKTKLDDPTDKRSSRRCPHHHHNPMYILAYSASGGQLVRYLMDAANPFLSRIRAIAFTDSTHNVQWARNNPRLSSLLESPSCVYVRSANADRDGIDRGRDFRAGEEVPADPHWRRRFGAVRTVWAGTAVHELANWAAHAHIWEHFDRHFHLLRGDPNGGGGGGEQQLGHERNAYGRGSMEVACSDDSSAGSSGPASRGSRRFRSRDFGAITV